jgi:hypothetical protein
MTMKKVRLSLTILFAGLLSGVFVPRILFAQAVPSQAAQVDDEHLRNFAKVYVQVEKIRQEYEPRAKGAANPDEGKQIQEEAKTKFRDALTKEGMTEENYSQIVQVARADEGVRKKVLQMIAEERAKS